MGAPAFLLDTASTGWTLTEGAGVQVALGLAPAALAARHWPRGAPRAIALERAIDEVEEAIERSPLRHADRGLLRLSAAVQAVLPPWPGAGDVLSRDEVEQAFSRLVAASDAAGAAGPVLGVAGEGAAALLMLRELMHHLGFSQLQALD
jgi:hypothetical protein